MRKAPEALALILALSLGASAAVTPLAPAVPAVQAQPLSGDPLKATIHRLSNGLTVYLSPSREIPRVSAWIAVRTGSKNDPADHTGLAHYLEHMLFKGTTRLGALDFAKEKPHLDEIARLYDVHSRAKDESERARLYKLIDAESIEAAKHAAPSELARVYEQLGFRGLNAFTSDEYTMYVVDLPSNRLATWAAMEAERFSAPVFRLFQSELEAVYEEKNRGMDNAERALGEALNRTLYKKHPYGQQTTIGEIEHLKNPSLTRMAEYYRRWYVPNNMAVALAGDFEPAAALALLEKSLGAWRPRPLPAAKAWPLPPPVGTERVEVRQEAEEKVVIAWPTVPYLHPDADALTVMDMLMDNAVAGLINLELNQAQKVKAAGSGPSFYNDAGDWEAWAVPKRGQTLEEAEALLLETVEHLKEGRFAGEDIQAVVTAFEVGEKGRLESNDARVNVMADSFVRFEPWPDTVARLERIRRVTKDDVLRVARRYLGKDRVVAYRRNGAPVLPKIAKPSFTKVDVDGDRTSAFASAVLAAPVPPVEPRWLAEGRDYRAAELPSGKAYAARNPFNDLFALQLVFDRGSRDDRALCAALALLDLAGAGSMTAEELKKKLFGLGTSLRYSCGERESSVSLTGLDEHLWESLELMRRRFEDPRLDEETLKKFVDVTIGARQDAKRHPDAVFGALGEFARLGKESPVLAELRDAELQALKLGRLIALARDLPGNRHRVGYVGNRPLGELAKLLETGRRHRQPAPRPKITLLRPDSARVLFTHRDMVQAQVGLFVADEPFDPRRPESIVDYRFLSLYLDGGNFTSLLFQEIREARSLAYGVWGQYREGMLKGDDNELSAGLGTQADKTAEAAALLRALAVDPPFSQQRFDQTARQLEQIYRTDPIPFRSIPNVLMAWEDLDLPPGDPRPARFQRLLAYTPADFQSFARRLKDKPATLYVLGHRDRLQLEELKRLGRFEERSLSDLFPY